MKKIIKVLKYCILFYIMFIIVGCKDEDKTKNVNQQNGVKSKKIQALIFCDLTSSIDSMSIKKVAMKICKTISELPQGSNVVALPIDNNTFAEPIFTCSTPVKKGNLLIHSSKYNQELSKMLFKIKNAILTNYMKVNSNSKLHHSSCIISSLNTTYNYFNKLTIENKQNHFEFFLYYFSDMIEQCQDSEAGSIFICGTKNTPKKSSIIDQIDKRYKPNFNLYQLIKTNIKINVTSTLIDQPKCLRPDELKEVWAKIFSKVGYSPEAFSEISFSQI